MATPFQALRNMLLFILTQCWIVPLCFLADVVSAGNVDSVDGISRSRQGAQQRRLEQGHLQSGPDPDGGSFASSGFVDLASQTLHIIGTTYGKVWTDGGSTDAANGPSDPSCFYAVARLPTFDSGMVWLHSETLGKAFVEEGCLGLFLNGQRSFVVGYSDANDGLLESIFDTAQEGAENAELIGMILDYKFDAAAGYPTAQNPLQLQGGRVSFSSKIVYPVAIAGMPGSNSFHVAYMQSSNGAQTDAWGTREEPDPSEILRYGSSYFMSIERYVAQDTVNAASGDLLQKTISGGSPRYFAVDGGESVQVSALLRLPDRIVVAGYTKGENPPFHNTDTTSDTTNLDGFITQLNSATMQNISDAPPTYRIASGSDDFVTGLCATKDPDHVFVTGYTQGHLMNPATPNDHVDSMRAFVMKLRLFDMEPIWIQEFSATPGAGKEIYASKAISCALTSDGAYVYVAGNVEENAHMTKDASIDASFGGTDVWIAQIAADTAKSIFLKQLGSAADDTVAFRGGVQVDQNNNAVLIGNTRGRIYRDRLPTEQDYADVFLATFEINTGDHMLPMEHADFVSLPPQTTLAPMAAPPTPQPVAAPVRPANPTPAVEEEQSSGGLWVVLLGLLLLSVVGVFGLGTYWNCCHVPKREAVTDRSKVLDYLHDFDVEDVELKHSATGGWHCTYVNDLAHGKNRQVQNDDFRNLLHNSGDMPSSFDPLTASSTHSSVSGRRANRRAARSVQHDDGFTSSDDEVVTFGENRDVRKERKSNIDRFIRSSGGASVASADGERRRGLRKTRSGFATSAASVSSADSGPISGGRINDAKDRWVNREII